MTFGDPIIPKLLSFAVIIKRSEILALKEIIYDFAQHKCRD